MTDTSASVAEFAAYLASLPRPIELSAGERWAVKAFADWLEVQELRRLGDEAGEILEKRNG